MTKTKTEQGAMNHFIEEIVPHLDSNHQTVCLLTVFLKDFTDYKGDKKPEEVLVLKDFDTAMMWARSICEELILEYAPNVVFEENDTTRQLIDFLRDQNIAHFVFQEKDLITKDTKLSRGTIPNDEVSNVDS